MKKIYCDTLQGTVNQESFKGISLYHGFNAFHAMKPWEYKFNTLKNNPQRQICTSTKYLGIMGVVVEGDILIASSYDLCSCVDGNRRYFDEREMYNLVDDYADLELHEDDPEENNEIVITNVKIKGIWVTSDAPNSVKAIAAKLAKENNLPLLQMGESIFN